MSRIDVFAIGKMKDKSLLSLMETYKKRLGWQFTLYEISDRDSKASQNQQILDKIDSLAYRFALDEKGKSLSSIAFSNLLSDKMTQGISRFQFMIGGADGLTPEVRESANALLAFGKQTWPHMMARVMLMEQIYRAQQIIQGHPYHRE